jgi:hypothetical protein
MAELSRRAVLALGLSAFLPVSCRAESKAAAKPVPARRPRPDTSKPVPTGDRGPRVDPFEFDSELFARKIAPEPGDWLDRFPEIHQSFTAYVQSSPPRPTAERKRIVLQPLGAFAGDEPKLFERLREHAALFFAVPVELAPTLPLPRRGRRNRKHSRYSWVQHRTSTILEQMLAPRLPADAIISAREAGRARPLRGAPPRTPGLTGQRTRTHVPCPRSSPERTACQPSGKTGVVQ